MSQVAKITFRLSFTFFSLDSKNYETYMTSKRLGRVTWHTAHCVELETKVPFSTFSFVVDFDLTVTFMVQKYWIEVR